MGGDGDSDLVYGRTQSDSQVVWSVRGSELVQFGNVATWASDAGDAGDLFRLGDGNGGGGVDLFYGRPLGMTSLTATPNPALIRWYGRLSSGTGFGAYTTWCSDAGDEGDQFP